MKTIPIAPFAFAAALLLVPVEARQPAPSEQHEHDATPPQASGTINHAQMMADMKATDVRLGALVQKMKSARGDDKTLAMQELLTELVQSQVSLHTHAAMMHTMMMSQMPSKGVSK
ncbi:MAG: hypothetical protein ABJA98_18890 [Acidobacteriota bacterium]